MSKVELGHWKWTLDFGHWTLDFGHWTNGTARCCARSVRARVRTLRSFSRRWCGLRQLAARGRGDDAARVERVAHAPHGQEERAGESQKTDRARADGRACTVRASCA